MNLRTFIFIRNNNRVIRAGTQLNRLFLIMDVSPEQSAGALRENTIFTLDVNQVGQSSARLQCKISRWTVIKCEIWVRAWQILDFWGWYQHWFFSTVKNTHNIEWKKYFNFMLFKLFTRGLCFICTWLLQIIIISFIFMKAITRA